MPFLGHCPREKENTPHQDTIPNVHSCLMHNSPKLKQPKCPSADKEINRLCYVQTTEYVSTINRNKLMMYTKMWMSRSSIMLRESNQTQRPRRVYL